MISWNLNSNNPEVGTPGHILVSAEGFQERDSRKDMYHEKMYEEDIFLQKLEIQTILRRLNHRPEAEKEWFKRRDHPKAH